MKHAQHLMDFHHLPAGGKAGAGKGKEGKFPGAGQKLAAGGQKLGGPVAGAVAKPASKAPRPRDPKKAAASVAASHAGQTTPAAPKTTGGAAKKPQARDQTDTIDLTDA